MDSNMFDGFPFTRGGAIVIGIALACGCWKVIELLLWAWRHISVAVT